MYPLVLANETVGQMQTMDLNDLRNGLTIKHVISVSPDMRDDEIQKFIGDLQRSNANDKRYDVVRAGEVDITLVGQPRNDKFSEMIYNMSSNKIDSVFGIPVGFWSESSLANRDAAYDAVLDLMAYPLACQLAEDFSNQAIVPWYGDEHRGVFEDFRTKDLEFTLKKEESDRKFKTFNEVRAENGLPPHPNDSVGYAPFDVAGQVAVQVVSSGGSLTDNTTGVVINGEVVPGNVLSAEAEKMLKLIDDTRSELLKAVDLRV